MHVLVMANIYYMHQPSALLQAVNSHPLLLKVYVVSLVATFPCESNASLQCLARKLVLARTCDCAPSSPYSRDGCRIPCEPAMEPVAASNGTCEKPRCRPVPSQQLGTPSMLDSIQRYDFVRRALEE